ncbi:MAG TPA: VOC family protein [Saprospiraceae bacterium]|nr:VOC family protein [Saprospiraceae bacterium]
MKNITMIVSVIPKLPFVNKADTIIFYVNQLEFELKSDYGDYLIMEKDGVEVHFFSFPSLIPEKSDFMVYVRIDTNIESLFEQYKSKHPALKWILDLETKPWGQKEFSLSDPSGTCLTFGQSV